MFSQQMQLTSLNERDSDLTAVADGKHGTPSAQLGEHIKLTMSDEKNTNICGTIDQLVVQFINPQ